MYQIACRTAPGVTQWYFPNGSAVPESNADVYQLSQGDTGLAVLYISVSSISNGTFPVGQYSCMAVGHMKGYIGLYLNGRRTCMFLFPMCLIIANECFCHDLCYMFGIAIYVVPFNVNFCF